jgi:hypothetical protein
MWCNDMLVWLCFVAVSCICFIVYMKTGRMIYVGMVIHCLIYDIVLCGQSIDGVGLYGMV